MKQLQTLEYGPSWSMTDIMRDIRSTERYVIKAQQVWINDTLICRVWCI